MIYSDRGRSFSLVNINHVKLKMAQECFIALGSRSVAEESVLPQVDGSYIAAIFVTKSVLLL